MVVCVHQPEHIPWLGFFDKARQADVLVLLDHVQYRKNYYQNRNRIRANDGPVWLTVPVLTKGKSQQRLNDIHVDNAGNPRWMMKCWNALSQNYGRARYWGDHESFLHEVYTNREWRLLVDLNLELLRYLLDALSIRVRVLRSSEMAVSGQRSALLLNVCRTVGCTVYLSGISGRDYLDVDEFTRADIAVRFQEFHHPVYRQLHEPFMPCMSSLDLLLNYGPASLDVIKGIGVETLDSVFR